MEVENFQEAHELASAIEEEVCGRGKGSRRPKKSGDRLVDAAFTAGAVMAKALAKKPGILRFLREQVVISRGDR